MIPIFKHHKNIYIYIPTFITVKGKKANYCTTQSYDGKNVEILKRMHVCCIYYLHSYFFTPSIPIFSNSFLNSLIYFKMKPSLKKSQLHSKIKLKLKFTSKQYLSYIKKMLDIAHFHK